MFKIPARKLAVFIGIICLGTALSASHFEKSEYAERRQKLMAQIPEGIAIILGAQPRVDYNEFFQNNDFMYFCGVEIPDSILIIDGIRKESTLFFTISERKARSLGIDPDLIENPEESTGIGRILPRANFSSYISRLADTTPIFYPSFKPEELMRECSREKLGTLQRTMIQNQWDGRLTREVQFVNHLKNRYPQVAVKDVSKKIWDLRIIKSAAEINLMRKTASIAVRAHTELIKSTRPGLYEYELAALYEYLCRKEGARDLAYYMIICSAENHLYAHYHKHNRLLKDGEFLVIDVGPDYGYYDIDITVSYPVNGRFSPRQKEIYEACLAVHEANLSVYRPDLTVSQVRAEVNEILKKRSFDLSKDYFKRMRGGFGHYVGMAVHDVGGSPKVLKAGMVFANEPMAIFAEENLGVRVENTILITETGCENLTDGIPRTVKEIEAIMKRPGLIQVLKKAGLY